VVCRIALMARGRPSVKGGPAFWLVEEIRKGVAHMCTRPPLRSSKLARTGSFFVHLPHVLR